MSDITTTDELTTSYEPTYEETYEETTGNTIAGNPNDEMYEKNIQKDYLNSINNQNTQLENQINYLNGTYSADNQKIVYEQSQINFWIRINFWLLYTYILLALIYAIKLFAYGTGTLRGKIFWYLHILFLPYLAIYIELAVYLFLTYIYDWVTGKPFVMWNYFTSYPPFV